MIQFPVGTSDFRAVREKQVHYVDKTALISELLADSAEVVLITRPRRFGKTLNLTMLREFFDHRCDNRALFTGLAVAQDPVALAELGCYPTLFLSFKDLKPSGWALFERQFTLMVGILARSHRDWLIRAGLDDYERERLELYCRDQADLAYCEQALAWLSATMHRLTGRRVMILIDEYDTPINAAFREPCLPQIVQTMRNFLSAGLKDNPALQKGVLTGILRVAKETIFSGLNNLSVHSLLNDGYAAHFGFTEAEVHQLCQVAGVPERFEDLREWYDGYRCGAYSLYNPWSIVNALHLPQEPLADYWTNASDLELIRDLATRELAPRDLATLLAGETLERSLGTAVALNALRPGHTWSLMFHAGMLTKQGAANQGLCSVRIPNREVATIFKKTVAEWLGGESSASELYDSLLGERLDEFSLRLQEAVVHTLSFHDTSKDREAAFHLFMAGLFAHLRGTHEVLSNREAGHGRYDLALMPRKIGQPGFVFEFKHGKASGSEDPLEALQGMANQALAQIEQQDYLAPFRDAGITRVWRIGIGWGAKRVAVAYQGPEQRH